MPFLLAVAAAGVKADPSYHTLVVRSMQGVEDTNNVAVFVVNTNEAAEVVAFQAKGSASVTLDVEKGGASFGVNAGIGIASNPCGLTPIAGPATIRLRSDLVGGQTGGAAYCTIKLTPGSFPPNRTILVPPGTDQFNIALECSTNLLQWFPATNGLYGPLPEAKFFRIKVEKIAP